MDTPLSAGERALWWSSVLLCLAVALASTRYLPGVGPIPPIVGGNLHVMPFLVLHAAGALVALAIAPFQVSATIRQRHRRLHRLAGRVYMGGIVLGGVSGLVLAVGASTGPVSQIGFGSLALIWLATAAMGWRTALQRDFVSHRRWMIRSFALTLSAVTLRLYLPVAGMLPIPFEDSYRAISFLAWVPNLLVAELWLRRRRTGTA
jgi:uncharacterized membrane protein